MSKNSRLVYSTETGRIKPPKNDNPFQTALGQKDNVVRIRRETKGRGGKAVCVVSGLPAADLKKILKQLKTRCATGGAVKEGCIEIQGEHRERIKSLLEADGYSVKFSGG